MKIRFLIAVALLTSGQLLADNVEKSWKFNEKWSLSSGGTFVLTNVHGNIEIIGVEGTEVSAQVIKTVTAVDQASLDEGRKHTELRSGGDMEKRFVTTYVPVRSPKWSSSVYYVVRVPRTAHVQVQSHIAQQVRVTGIRGNVTVKSFAGQVRLENVSGATTVQGANCHIQFIIDRPVANTHLETINGSIQVVVQPTSSFKWLAETLTGHLRSTIPVRGTLTGTSYNGQAATPGGPTLRTISTTGSTFLLERGTTAQQAIALRDLPGTTIGGSLVAQPAGPNDVRHEVWQGRFTFNASIGNVRINEVRGDAQITTGAGEIFLGSVSGRCSVTSEGGPLNLGDIAGNLVARTRAGDITVNAAREGGYLGTAGGTIRLMYTGGPTTMTTGGGDIIVRQSAAQISADTRSGDVNLTVDRARKTDRIDAKTLKGNILLNLPRGFGADVEATVLTTDPDSNTIRSDFPGLSFSREQFGSKIRIRATGKINGGGEKVELSAEDGGIQIVAKP